MKNFKKDIFLFLLLTFLGVVLSGTSLYTQSDLERAKGIVSQMTLTQKIDFLGGRGMGTKGYPNLGVVPVEFADSTTGVRGSKDNTAFPSAIAMASTWNRGLIAKSAKAIALEAQFQNIKVILGPGMNIYRVPQNGRNFEYFGEDPYLVATLTTEYIRAMQNEGIIATAKHFVANNQDYDRHRRDSILSERALHEIYMPAFKAAVEKAGVKAIMTAYNPVNGIHASEHPYLLTEILRQSWGFNGIIMSDWSSTYSALPVYRAGLDLEMPTGKWLNPTKLLGAFKKGELSEEELDTRITRTIAIFLASGSFERVEIVVDYEEHNVIAKEIAQEGIVLLKNEGNFLPLDKKEVKRIAVFGPNAIHTPISGGGAAFVEGNRTDPFFAALQASGASQEMQIDYFQSCDIERFSFNKIVDRNWNRGARHPGTWHTPATNESIFADTKLVWEEKSEGFFTATYTPLFNGRYKFIFQTDKPGQLRMNNANLAKKSREFYRLLRAGKDYQLSVKSDSDFQLGIEIPAKSFDEYKKLAVEGAAGYDVVFVCVGFDSRTECESRDRPFELFEEQRELIQALGRVNKKVVVIINAGGGVEMSSWIDGVPAVIHSWYLGQNAGTPLTEVIWGDVNPSGKLPISIEKRWEDNCAFGSYDPKFTAPFCDKEPFNGYAWREHDILPEYYPEGIFIGYRHHEKNKIEPLFPFGHGLSYTEFEYGDLKLSAMSMDENETIEVSFTVTNIGERKGKEIVQLYIADLVSSLPRPVKELKGYEKVELEPNESKEITLLISGEALQFYDELSRNWVAEAGNFEVMIGASTQDVRLRGEFALR